MSHLGGETTEGDRVNVFTTCVQADPARAVGEK